MTRYIMTGAAGNTGSRVLRRLLASSDVEQVVTFVRSSNLEEDLHKDPRVLVLRCDATDTEAWKDQITPDHVLVDTANLRVGAAILPTLESIGVQRAFCVTTTGVYSRYHSYSALYREIEERYRASLLEITILRPSMIYGNDRDYNMHKLIRFLSRSPVFPMFGNGQYLMQPVHVDDLAWGISQAVLTDTIGELNLAGAAPLTYREIVDTIIRELDTRTRILPVSHRLAAVAAKGLQKVPGFPISHEQVMRLVEDKNFDIDSARNQLGYDPMDFGVGIRKQIHGSDAN